jgi:hypothetical protein
VFFVVARDLADFGGTALFSTSKTILQWTSPGALQYIERFKQDRKSITFTTILITRLTGHDHPNKLVSMDGIKVSEDDFNAALYADYYDVDDPLPEHLVASNRLASHRVQNHFLSNSHITPPPLPTPNSRTAQTTVGRSRKKPGDVPYTYSWAARGSTICFRLIERMPLTTG